jgi:hypothetical protein
MQFYVVLMAFIIHLTVINILSIADLFGLKHVCILLFYALQLYMMYCVVKLLLAYAILTFNNFFNTAVPT